MNVKHSGLVRIVLFAGTILLTACMTTSSPNPIKPQVGAQCGQDEDACNILSGYSGNSFNGGFAGGTIAGGGQRGAPNQVNGEYGVVGGGEGNLAGEGSTVSGGSSNTAIHFHATVGGGANNVANAEEATVGGGLKNTASQRFAVVGGGALNIASDMNTTVSGGSGNVASAQFGTVGGGTQNLASSTAAVVSGGDHNLAQGPYSSVLGGLNNEANGYLTIIGGGGGNIATGSYAVIPGGFANQAAGDYSFAAGHNADVKSDHPGAFLFADSNRFEFPSLSANEFAVRATGGARFVTGIDDSGKPLSGVRLSAGSGTWESLSDYNSKAGFAAVDGQHVLEQLMSIPISTWYYRTQDPSIRHIGPMAQDFHAAFNVGQDGHYISTVDEEGVALAAIQELYRIVQGSETFSQQQRIDSLESRLAFANGLAAASFLLAVAALWRRAPIAKRR
jgi:hypothetical protein